MGYSFDYTYILVLIGALISLIASLVVKITFSHYNKVRNINGYTAEQVAMMIMREAGINNVRIGRISGSLTDHYDPTSKTLRLSDSVYGSQSVAAIGVAAHECGHAIQDKEKYFPLVLRKVSVPVANIGSKLSWPVILLGVILGYYGLIKIGIILFCAVVAFQIITLPVEFDASHRALKILGDSHILAPDEKKKAGRVLRAAASTYVAAAFSSILQLFRFILLARGGRSRK